MNEDLTEPQALLSFQPRTILNLDIEYEHSDGDTSESEAFETEPSHEDIKASFFRLLRCPHEFQDFDAACLILSQMLSILPEDDECVSMIYEIYDNLVELQENPPADNPYSVPFVTRSNENENIARLLALVVGYEEQYGLEGKLSDLERAIGCIERVIELTDEDHPCFPEYLGILGNFLLARFEHLGDTQYLADAIYEQERAVSLVLDTRPNLCSDLGYSLLRRYRVFGELEDLDGAIENQEKAICAATNENKDTSIWIIRLADSLLLRFERLGHQADANKAVELYERVLPVNPHPDQRPAILNNLGSALQKRFMHFRNLEDINRAIRRQDEAVALTPETHINMPIWLTNLGNSLQLRFEHSSALEDIELAISHQEHALRILPQGHALNSSVLNDLGNSLRLRFGWSGEPADINQAITWLSKSVELTAVGHTERPRWLDSLGNALRQKFEMIGDLIDIDKAITVLSEAVSCSTDGHIDQPDRLNHLGNAYISRFDRLGEASDVENAIECHRKAISLDSQGGVKRIGLLGDLASSLLTRFRIFRNLLDVDEAIASQREAIGVCPPGHSAMPALLSNLGGFFQTRYRHTKELEDLSESISCLKNSINLTPDDHVDKPSSYCLLGSSYEERFRRLDELDDINQAVEFHTSAVNLTPEYHMDRAAFLYELANCIALRCYTTSDTTDLDLATDTYRRAALSPVGKPMVRFRAAHKWALTAMRYRVEPLEAYRAALDIIPQVVWLGTTINRRYQDISSIGNFITDAVANAISSQEYDLALEWLEEGRSIVWQQMLQLRTPMDDLRSVDASRADQLEQLARTLERAGSSKVAQGHSRTADPELSGEEAAQAHRRLAEEWANSVEQVRELPGFSDFLRPRKASTLMKAAQNGPVVAINVQSGRCDALVINPGTMHVSCVPLPNLTYAKAASAQKSLIRSLQLAGVRFRAERRPIKRSAPPVEHKIEDVLEFLWVDVVEPVLTYLNYLNLTPNTELPRITWCATGPLAFLPLHAAGRYKQAAPHSRVFSYVTSSYTPTIGGLTPRTPVPNEFSGILAIGQPSTPGQSSLPGTVEELSAIVKSAGSLPITQLVDHAATQEAVLSSIITHSWVHFACHACQDLGDPTASAFYLHDGTLDLGRITKQSMGHKEFAFLSACQTATGDESLPEEAVHLAAGMIMAGYPTVIATMWSIKDNDAPLIAQHTYAEILAGGHADSTKACGALHNAVGQLRQKVGEKAFESWVPYIHIGV